VSEHKEQPLSATTFEPAPIAANSAAIEETKAVRKPAVIGLGLAGLLLLFVFFVLPSLVAPDDPTQPGATVDNSAGTTEGSPFPNTTADATPDVGEGRSPFAEAQESALRREAQEILQTLLSKQSALEALGAARWAETTYRDALKQAALGDTAYRERDFEQAIASYRAGVEQLEALEQSLPGRIDALLATLTLAIEAGDLLAAQARLNQLVEMAPADSRLVDLSERVDALPQVIGSLEAAALAETEGDYAAAVADAGVATQADPLHLRAQRRLSELQRALTEQRFTAAMTAGYAALAQAEFDRAKDQFEAAARLQPGAPEPSAALAELDQARTQARLLSIREQAERAEQEERWQDAIALFNEALAIDALILYANDGIARAEPRANLDKRLEAIVTEKNRLIDRRVLRLAQETLDEAQVVPSPGTRLQGQIAAATAIIDYATTPVTIEMSSDGLTDITVLRVQRLGLVQRQILTLRPGTYTAVGMRTGFRDVRIQFEVKPGQLNAVDVRCVEAI
jgi:tetratricopeptide (TPR) repeat protein